VSSGLFNINQAINQLINHSLYLCNSVRDKS